MKSLLLMIWILNLAVLYAVVSHWFVTPAQLAKPHSYYQGIDDMRDFMGPPLGWLAVAATANLIFASIAVFRSPSATAPRSDGITEPTASQNRTMMKENL
jgi:hypothetical protein